LYPQALVATTCHEHPHIRFLTRAPGWAHRQVSRCHSREVRESHAVAHAIEPEQFASEVRSAGTLVQPWGHGRLELGTAHLQAAGAVPIFAVLTGVRGCPSSMKER
jgi:hypothetical protein